MGCKDKVFYYKSRVYLKKLLITSLFDGKKLPYYGRL